jgi:hypothetical protein
LAWQLFVLATFLATFWQIFGWATFWLGNFLVGQLFGWATFWLGNFLATFWHLFSNFWGQLFGYFSKIA